MKASKNAGFTLVEVLIVVVIMAVLAATIIPQFSDSANDAKVGTAEFNLHTLRSQIQLFKAQHDGVTPTTLAVLTQKTNKAGAVGATASHVYGPYIQEIPANPFNELATEKALSAAPTASDADEATGWLYHAAGGQVYINDPAHYTK